MEAGTTGCYCFIYQRGSALVYIHHNVMFALPQHHDLCSSCEPSLWTPLQCSCIALTLHSAPVYDYPDLHLHFSLLNCILLLYKSLLLKKKFFYPSASLKSLGILDLVTSMFKDSSSKDKTLQTFQILVSYSKEYFFKKFWEGRKKSDEVACVYQMTFISYEVQN